MKDTVSAVNQRLKQFMKANRISVNYLSKELDVPQPTLHRQLSDDGMLSLDNLQAILMLFPKLSSDWVLLGVGSMVRSDSATVGNDAGQSSVINLLQEQLNEEKVRCSQYWDTIQKLISK